jgi:4-amino-4-deoxy-L-arabinose transferase-like glycosyltransferase
VWQTNPFARIDMPTWLVDSYQISKSYIWVGVIRTNGVDVPSEHLPWWYAPSWLLAQLPLLMTAAIAMGAFFCICSLLGRRWGVGRGPLLALTPLLLQGVVLPLGIVATGSVLYDGIRHLLFMFPGLAAIAAVGVASLQRGLPRSGRKAWLAPAVAGLVVAASLFATVRWFPYMYAYVNPVAGWDKSQRNWELDYWGVTAREGVDRLRDAGLNPIAVVPASEPSRPFGGLTEDEVAARTVPKWGLYAFLRWDAHLQEQWCTRKFTIERDGLVLGEGGYCPK